MPLLPVLHGIIKPENRAASRPLALATIDDRRSAHISNLPMQRARNVSPQLSMNGLPHPAIVSHTCHPCG